MIKFRFSIKNKRKRKDGRRNKKNICLKCNYFSEHLNQYEKYRNCYDKIKKLEGELNPENL